KIFPARCPRRAWIVSGGNVPTYQYACTECGNQLEVVQSFSDDPLTQCPACEGRLRKLFGSVGVVFKGPGFYRTDSRAGANGSGANGNSARDKGAKSKDGDSSTSAAKTGAAKDGKDSTAAKATTSTTS